MRYSFIIPTLNEEELLPKLLKQIEKVKTQIADIEIIISDGGSSDNTINIGQKHSAKIVQTKNRNQTIAEGRNDGAKQSTGNVLIFINADVQIFSTEIFLKELEKFERSNFYAMTCKVKVIKEEEKFSDKLFLGFYNLYFHFLNIIGVGMGRGECQVIKREIFKKVGGYNKNLIAGEDFDLYRRIRKLGKIFFSRKIIICESPRRYRKEGHLKVLLKWFLNGILVLLKKKSYSKNWEQVR